MVLENHAGQFFLWQQMRKNNHTKSRPPAKPEVLTLYSGNLLKNAAILHARY